jgi:HAE1 family hydrophobic/amphiphilic exporter-1
MEVQDIHGGEPAELEAVAQSLVAAAGKTPGLISVFTTFNTRTPKIYADIDRVRAEMLGVNTDDVFQTLEVYLGSQYVNDFNFLGRTYRVMAQADGDFRQDLHAIGQLKTRNAKGEMVPLSSVASFRDITGPYRIEHFNLFPSAAVQGGTAPGYSTGYGLAAMDRLAAATLPDGYAAQWTEIAYQEQLAGNTAIFVFAASVVFVFLLLSAQYESWTLPLAVILIVPMCLLAAVSGLLMRGMDVNILAQIGFVVLIGLAAKNAILIVEFARQNEEHGEDRLQAATEAARVRLRPILMTSFAFILGVLPLVIATGAGAEMRQSLGTAVFFGMIGVTVFGLIFTPVFYVVMRKFARKPRAHEAPRRVPAE